jgi:hypothetical protein
MQLPWQRGASVALRLVQHVSCGHLVAWPRVFPIPGDFMTVVPGISRSSTTLERPPSEPWVEAELDDPAKGVVTVAVWGEGAEMRSLSRNGFRGGTLALCETANREHMQSGLPCARHS